MSRKKIYHSKFQNRIDIIKEQLKDNYDVKYREVELDLGMVCIIYTDTITDAHYISQYIVQPLIKEKNKFSDIEKVKNEIITAHQVEFIDDEKKALLEIVSGNIILLFSFADEILNISAKKFDVRAIEEPPTETVIKGPREGFNENLSTNISLVRKRIKDPDLRLERISVGNKNKEHVVLVYINNITPEYLVSYVRDKLNSLDKDFVYYSDLIEESLKEKYTAFDTVGYTEKPDAFVSKIVEGRVGIIVDGTPFTVFVPYFFIENVMAADDYYLNKFGQNFFRIIRWVSLLIALVLPGLYVALTTHHFELIPSIFVFRLAVLRAGVPYPTIVEVWIMMFFFQVLREAGVRLPQAIGPAISIVGALILGDAAIRSGLASEVTVLIVALSSISLFLIPKLHGALSIWGNIIVIASALSGLPGFYISFILFCTHISSLTSCGYPYLFPLGTLNAFKLRDTFIRGDIKDISNNLLKKDENQ